MALRKRRRTDTSVQTQIKPHLNVGALLMEVCPLTPPAPPPPTCWYDGAWIDLPAVEAEEEAPRLAVT